MKYSSVAVLVMLLVAAADIALRFAIFGEFSNESTLVALSLNLLALGVILALLCRRTWLQNLPKGGRYAWGALLIWGVITLLRGVFQAQDYWAWKTIATNHLFMLLVPLAMVIGLDVRLFHRIHWAVLWLLFPLGVLLLPLSFAFDTELFSRVVLPSYLLVLMLPFLKWRYWIPLIVVSVASVLVDPSYRANLIRIVLAVAVLLLYVSR